MLKYEHVYRGDTMTAAIKRAIRSHLYNPTPDAVLNIETHMFNTIIVADSCDYDLDIGREVWLNQSRWSRLIKEYVPLDALERFVSQARDILDSQARLGATANMMFRDPDRYAKKHRWGGCLMGATFRGDNHKSGPATLTFYSRTTYMGYMALLDGAIASVLGRIIGGGDPTKIGFRWYISSQQLHCFKTLPYVYSKPVLLEKLESISTPENVEVYRSKIAKGLASPTWYHMAKWYIKVLQSWKDADGDPALMLSREKYGPFRRIKRRWLEHQGYLSKNIPPSLHVRDLTFGKAV